MSTNLNDTNQNQVEKATKSLDVNTEAAQQSAQTKESSVGDVSTTQLVLLICVVLFWFVGAILYLVLIKPEGINKILTLLAIIIPVIAGVLLILNTYKVINLGK